MFSAFSEPCRTYLGFMRLSKAHPALLKPFGDLSSPSQPLEALWGPLSSLERDGQMDGRIYEKFPCILQGIVLFGTAALIVIGDDDRY